MDYRARFNDLLAFIEEYWPHLQDLDSDAAQFFLRLSPEDYKLAEISGIEAVCSRGPRVVKDILRFGEEVVQFPNIFVPVPPSIRKAHSAFFKGMTEKKVLEVFNYNLLFQRYLSGIDFVLDVATGMGHLANYLQMNNRDLAVLGVDIEAKYVGKARRKAFDQGLQTDFEVRDAKESLDDFLIGNKNAVVSLHGCGSLSQRVLRLPADLLMVVPCCYSKMKPEEYFMSSYASSASTVLVFGEQFGHVAILGPGFLNGTDKVKMLHSVEAEVLSHGFDDQDVAILAASGFGANGDLAQTIAAVHRVNRNYSLFKKLYARPIESLFSSDKAIFLDEQGYQSSVYIFMPSLMSPRNNLVVGVKNN